MSKNLEFTFRFEVETFVIYRVVCRSNDRDTPYQSCTRVGEITGRRCDSIKIDNGAVENRKFYQIDGDAWFPSNDIVRDV